jgi:integrase
MTEDEEYIHTGFDRNVDFKTIRRRLRRRMRRIYKQYQKPQTPYAKTQLINTLCYLLIAMIQLKNGSRISEACEAFRKFVKTGDLTTKVTVKIAKSSGLKYNNKTKQKTSHKSRYRQMKFPPLFDGDIFLEIYNSQPIIPLIKSDRLEKRVLDFLLRHFNCNTHSLRYACINYLLTEKEIPMPTVAKFVGHTNVSQLVTYTQNKQVEKLFDIDD